MTSEGFGTWLGRFRSHKRASITTTTSRRTPKQRTQEIKGFMHHELQTNTRSISIQKPRGHKEGRASFPTQIQYTTQEFIPKTLEKEREKNLRERESREEMTPGSSSSVMSSAPHPGGGACLFVQGPADPPGCLPLFLLLQAFL